MDIRETSAEPRAQQPVMSAAKWKQEGNHAVSQGMFSKAIDKYSTALRASPSQEEIEVIKRNRALAFLKTGRFDAALADTGFPTFDSHERPNEKALFRAAEALYKLQRFDEALVVLKRLCSLYPRNEDASKYLERTMCRIQEQETGKYDFRKLQDEVKNLKPPHLDFATYKGPIEMRMTESKGHGLFLTRPVKAGELLLCEKAFSYAYAKEGADAENTQFHLLLSLLKLDTSSASKGTKADLVRAIQQKLQHNPSVASDFKALYSGLDTDNTEPITDSSLVSRIVSHNVFKCPVSDTMFQKACRTGVMDFGSEYDSSGIWIMASRINHSCFSNCHRSFVGDMIIVRATRNMNADTELSFEYMDPKDDDIPERLLSTWGFTCTCAICLDNAAAGSTVLEERNRIHHSALLILHHSALLILNELASLRDIEKAVRLVNKLEGTYTKPAHQVPRVQLWDLQMPLGVHYIRHGKLADGLNWLRKSLISSGFKITEASNDKFRVLQWGLVSDTHMELFLHICDVFGRQGSLQNAKFAHGYAKLARRMLVGEDETSEDMFPCWEKMSMNYV